MTVGGIGWLECWGSEVWVVHRARALITRPDRSEARKVQVRGFREDSIHAPARIPGLETVGVSAEGSPIQQPHPVPRKGGVLP